jgi:hypothetical protein
MGPPSGDTQEAVNTDFPLYLYIEGDLPRACIWARMPYLRMQLRGKEHRRAKCAWCRRPQQEYGHHLIRCPSMPPRLRRRRDAVLAAIDQDVRMARHKPTAPAAEAVTEENLERLFMLSWEGTSKWKQSRHGSQNPRRDVHR